MARVGGSVEKLLEIYQENSDTSVQVIIGSGAPIGTSGETDDAPLGSAYFRTDSYKFYKKDTDSSAATDWIDLGSFIDLIGVSAGDLDMGTFTGSILSDNTDIKALLQELETYIESNLVENNTGTGVTTVAVIDDELVDAIACAKYIISISFTDAPAQRRDIELFCGHNGTGAADATLVDDTVYSKLKFGASFDYTLSVALSGTGAAQKMEVSLASTETNGVDYCIRKVSACEF